MEKAVTGKGDSTCNSLSQKRGPLIEGMKESPVRLDWNIKKVRPSGSTCGQVPGKGQMCSSTFEGHPESFELSSECSRESWKSLGIDIA